MSESSNLDVGDKVLQSCSFSFLLTENNSTRASYNLPASTERVIV